MQEADFLVKLGSSVRFSKTVAEADVYAFAGISGDFSAAHINNEYMKRAGFSGRIAHGALAIGFMSTAASLMFNPHIDKYKNLTPVSLGYDRVRFLKPILFGDTVTVIYTVVALDAAKMRCTADVKVVNQSEDLVAVSTHLMIWIES